MEKPITARNMDGTRNKLGTITSYVELPLKINGRTRRTRLLVTGLGKQRIILGFPWLNEQNPDINWKTGEFKWRPRKLVIKRWEDPTKTANPMKEAKNVVKQMLNQLEKEQTVIRVVVKDDEVLLIKKHAESAVVPTRGSPDAAGYDLYSAEEKVVPGRGKALIDTEISITVPSGTYGRIAPRSGLASKFMIATGAGVIDADY